MKRPWPYLASAAVGGAFVLFATTLLAPRPRTAEVNWSSPVVLEKVRSLGDLHTVRHQYSRTFEFGTRMERTDPVLHLPGVAQLVDAATNNRALVTAVGEVEAGVDLRRARWDGKTLVLPPPQVYAPRIELRVHDERRSLFWSDANLVPKTTEEASRNFEAAAREAGIREAARAEAERRLQALFPGRTIPLRWEA